MLMLCDREKISRGLAEGLQYKEIARRLGRDPSVISREVARHGGRVLYRAGVADEAAGVGRERPKLFAVERLAPSGDSHCAPPGVARNRVVAHDAHPRPNSPTRSERLLNVRLNCKSRNSPVKPRSTSASTKLPLAVFTGSFAYPLVGGTPRNTGSSNRHRLLVPCQPDRLRSPRGSATIGSEHVLDDLMGPALELIELGRSLVQLSRVVAPVGAPLPGETTVPPRGIREHPTLLNNPAHLFLHRPRQCKQLLRGVSCLLGR
jgi:hypothetical protein